MNAFRDVEKHNDPRMRERFLKLWKEVWIPSFDQPLSNSLHAANQAETLPLEFREASKIGDAAGNMFLEKLRTKEVSFLENTEEYESAYIMLVLSIYADFDNGKTLAAAVKQRGNNLLPTKGDLVAFLAVLEGLHEIQYSTIEDWQYLGESKNPIYRLLGLKAVARSSPAAVATSSEDQSTLPVVHAAQLNFYRQYLDETDSIVISTLINALSRIENKESREMLQTIRDKQSRLGNKGLVSQVDEALQNDPAKEVKP